jgi:hypothetical protein
MKTRTLAAIGLSGALAAGGCLLTLPASASSATATHTLTFTAITTSTGQFGKSGGATFNRDVNAAHKLIGYDVISFVGGGSVGHVALATGQGFLTGRLVFGSSGITGKVTGGTGAYAHATGSIVGHPISKTKTKVSITYHAHS